MGEFYKYNTDKEQFWKDFQVHMGILDEEVEQFRKNPRNNYFIPRMASPDIQDWTLVLECVVSHSCSNGMKVGDRLYFKNGCMMLDLERSTATCWCVHATQDVTGLANEIQNLLLAGVDDPNKYIAKPDLGCIDCDIKYGWGKVVMRAWCFRESLGENYKNWAYPELDGCYDE